MDTKTNSLFDTFNMLNPTDAKLNELIKVEERKFERENSQQSVKIENDYDLTRNNLIRLLGVAEEALSDALLVAKDSEHPRAFEVVGQLIEKISNINEKLLILSEKKQKLDANSHAKENQGTSNSPHNVTQNLFVGTTNDLKQMITNMKKKD